MSSYIDRKATASFRPTLYGQSAYILDQCEEEGIKAKHLYGQLYMYNKSKKERFLEICEESFAVHQVRTGLDKNVHIWAVPKGMMNHTLAVGIKEEGQDTIFTYEAALVHIVACQFVGVIPRVSRMVVLHTRDEFVETVLKKGIKII